MDQHCISIPRTEEQKLKSREAAKIFKKTYPEIVKASNKRRYEKQKLKPDFKEKQKAYNKAYREKNKAKINAKKREAYQKNKTLE
tara:strand:+ start:710 stop:964 length:255 start_codon:yes stop_codon:yes gene_type:complete